ncbi:hypothetical protein [Fischerella sp. PCC 9605]|uniref:hypothetical protein n=1 Tax=Fischerella sp. PCC 9605 TaxID=1173024 RepID=UPI0004B29CF6|nr:hypothetical protein [Fischerella sp. PCC 9605]
MTDTTMQTIINEPPALPSDAVQPKINALGEPEIFGKGEIMPLLPSEGGSSQLSRDEVDLLCEYESVISRGLETFYEVGHALVEIRNLRLYRAEFKTFQEYCEVRWHMTRQHAYRYIAADTVRRDLSPIGDKNLLPANESHIRELNKLKKPEDRQKVWLSVLSKAGGNLEKVTAAVVEEEVRKYLPAKEPRVVKQKAVVEPKPTKVLPAVEGQQPILPQPVTDKSKVGLEGYHNPDDIRRIEELEKQVDESQKDVDLEVLSWTPFKGLKQLVVNSKNSQEQERIRQWYEDIKLMMHTLRVFVEDYDYPKKLLEYEKDQLDRILYQVKLPALEAADEDEINSDKDKKIQSLEKEIAEKDKEIEQLRAELDEYKKPKEDRRKFIEYQNVSKTYSEWERYLGLSRTQISKRITIQGWTPTEAIEVPKDYPKIDLWRKLPREEQLQQMNPALKSLLNPELKAEISSE